jgi:hypothetical protein
MGKRLIHMSVWSQRSLFSAFSKLMTLIFALFCAATGQLSKSASTQGTGAASTSFKGTAYRLADSTVLGNIRLYLQACAMPLYGIYPDYGITPLYGISQRTEPMVTSDIVDSVITDEQGRFEVAFHSSGEQYFGLTSNEVTEAAGRAIYSSKGCLTLQPGTDSTYTIYLRKLTTAVKRESGTSAPPAVMSTFQGKTLHVRIPEWQHQANSASIVNSRGQNIATLTAAPDGTLSWDTRSVATGMYFLRLLNGPATFRLKILVN